MAERAWNAEPIWHSDADEQRYLADLQRFYSRVATVEMPRLAERQTNFRVSPPGLKVERGMLYANTPEPAATIHYTLDGTETSPASPVWSGPMPCASTTVRAIAIYLGRSSTVAEL